MTRYYVYRVSDGRLHSDSETNPGALPPEFAVLEKPDRAELGSSEWNDTLKDFVAVTRLPLRDHIAEFMERPELAPLDAIQKSALRNDLISRLGNESIRYYR